MSVPSRLRSGGKSRIRETLSLEVSRESGLYASAASFWRLCRANPDLRLERTSRGEVIVMAPACMDSWMRYADLTARLWNWNQTSRLGVVLDSAGGFTLPNRAVRAAEASWITLERWQAVSPDERWRSTGFCPDFVVEITSPSNTLEYTREKMLEYLALGVRLGWLLAPKSGLVEIYRPGRLVESIQRPPTLSGEDVLPGLVLDLKGILFD